MNIILLDQSDFTVGNKVVLYGRRLEHVTSVVKVKVGDLLKVGLVNGKMGTAIIDYVDKEKIELKVELNVSPPAPLPITLILALPRPKSLRKAMEVSSSIGIKKIYIIESWRVEKSYWSSPGLTDESLHEHLLLGLEQGRDTIVPEIFIRKRFKPFVEDELPSIVMGTRAFIAHPYEASPCPYALNTQLTLAIGPEGGFIPYEVDKFCALGFEPITIGERILRVENAIPAFAARLY